MTEPGDYFRASHADRERVADILRAAFLEGRLTEDELNARVARALGSRTYAELAVVIAGIPVILLAMGFRLGNEDMAVTGMTLFVVEFIVFILAGIVAVGTAVDSRMTNRPARAQLPPRPGPRGIPPSGGMPGIAFGPARPEALRPEALASWPAWR